MKSVFRISIRIIAGILAVLWMLRIFSFSSDEASVSGTVSRSMSFSFIEKVSRHLSLGWDEEKIEAVSKPVEKYLRKGAHMYEFGVLALLLCISFDVWRRPGGGIRYFLLPLLICLIYAATDEYHQTFVPGRSGEVRDVMIDLSGALISILIFTGIIRLLTGKKRSEDK